MIVEILNTVASALLGSISTIYLVEKKKTNDKKNLLLSVLRKELSYYDKVEKDDIGTPGWGTPFRSKITWSLLTTDVLHPKKDGHLLHLLYEFIGYVENYNTMNHLSNLSLMMGSEAIHETAKGRDYLRYNSQTIIDELKAHLDEKYSHS